MSEFNYEIDKNFDYIVDEKGNTFLALRKIRWGNASEFKLDLRKYYSTPNGEQMSKGVSFLTENGPNELVELLVEKGFGSTSNILNNISRRDDFISLLYSIEAMEQYKEHMMKVIPEEHRKQLEDENKETDFYDPRTSLLD